MKLTLKEFLNALSYNKIRYTTMFNFPHGKPSRWRSGRAFALHAGDQGSIPSWDRP